MERKSLVTLLLALGCGGGADTPAEAPACAIAPVEPGVLRADGTALVDAHGRAVTLRGINAGGRSKFAPYSPFDYGADHDAALAAYLDRAQAWGFDVLRVPFTWAAVEPERGSYDEEFLGRYDQLLDAAWQRGLWTIVDFHQDIYAEAYCGDGFPPWTLTDPPVPHHDCPNWFAGYSNDDRVRAAFDAFWSDAGGVQEAYAEMWELLAGRHRDRPGVIGYELINEPHQGTAGDLQAWEVGVLAPFYAEQAARVQARDPDALVFFDATGAESITARTNLARPAGANLVFAPHFYDPGAVIGGELDPDVEGRIAGWKAQGDEWGLPVLLGEYGIAASHPEAGVHARRHQDALDALGLGGTWWEYSDAAERWNEEDMSVIGPDGAERAAMLEGLVRPYARALAGQPLEVRFEPEAARFTLRYQAEANGVSEVVLPARVYPGEVAVVGTGVCVDRQGDRLWVRAEGGAVELTIEPK